LDLWWKYDLSGGNDGMDRPCFRGTVVSEDEASQAGIRTEAGLSEGGVPLIGQHSRLEWFRGQRAATQSYAAPALWIADIIMWFLHLE
jgi:hypothetical protein